MRRASYTLDFNTPLSSLNIVPPIECHTYQIAGVFSNSLRSMNDGSGIVFVTLGCSVNIVTGYAPTTLL